ncbi:hypothetical protein HY643_02475 [Candidatus Woesearchaeota archaeon]|nr:hypothetical protein [Candidatus Woesearchaeota archaeon]
MEKDDLLTVGVLAAGAGFFAGVTFMFAMARTNQKIIPPDMTVQTGYVIPGELKIKMDNLDGIGELETILIYKGQQFLFKESEKGIPVCIPYEITPKNGLTYFAK